MGLAPFGLYFCQNIVSIFLNMQFINIGGSEALACYSVVIYIAGITTILHRAIMDGSLPMISSYFGMKKIKKCFQTTLLMIFTSSVLFGVGTFITLIFKEEVAASFGVSKIVEITASNYLSFYLLGFAFICVSRTIITFMSAVNQKAKANLLSYGESFVMILLVSILSYLFSEIGIWIGIVLSYVLMGVFAIIIL